MQDNKGFCARALHWYLNDPISLAFSAAFSCGLVAFFFGTILVSLFAGKLVAVASGAALGLLGGVFAAREQLQRAKADGDKVEGDKPKSCCSSDRAIRWMATFSGGSIMACAALQVVGLSGNWLLLSALIAGAFVSTTFALVLNRR